ncbi:MAG TPA: nitroreductase/quinone reductase family protein [Acidimicrobiales bacterium]|nr:nitroreductase/quinone reductase family protein [Acidimicrobiales bacterium]
MTEKTSMYRKPGPFMRRFTNPVLGAAVRLGVSVWGSRVLEVRGRKSGTVRRTPVNLLSYEGREYLVSPRGDTQWARNVRADNGRLVLMLGRRRDERAVTELTDDEKPPVLRAYLRRWKLEVGMFFEGVGPGSSDQELLRIASKHPVFLLDKGNSDNSRL